ncbi:MAG: hypothetical protein WD055_02395 [Candidatus Dependentiae bacterium]
MKNYFFCLIFFCMNAYSADNEQQALKELNAMLDQYGIPLRVDENKNLLQLDPTCSPPPIKTKKDTQKTRRWYEYGTPPVTYKENPIFLKDHSGTKKSKQTKLTAKARRLKNRSVSYVIAHKIEQPTSDMEETHTVIEMSQEEQSLVSKIENEPHDSNWSPVISRLLRLIGY